MAVSNTDFAALFRSHYSSVYRYMRFQIDDDQIAEDLTAEVFERAYRAHRNYDPRRAAFSTWIGQIAHNHLSNYFAQQRRHQPDVLFNDAVGVPDNTQSPETQIIASETSRRLRYCLDQLPERDREIIALRFGAETRNKDIAIQLGLKERSVSVIIMRALERLRGCQEKS